MAELTGPSFRSDSMSKGGIGGAGRAGAVGSSVVVGGATSSAAYPANPWASSSVTQPKRQSINTGNGQLSRPAAFLLLP